MKGQTILDRWQITAEELTEIVDANPSMRGNMFGYVAESKLRDWLERNGIAYRGKSDDHDRKNKGDLIVEYNGYTFIVESKSLQTNSVRGLSDLNDRSEHWRGTFQVDASDCRDVILENGSKVKTTSLKYGDFDLLAVNLFAFRGKWEFAFAKNEDLPSSNDKKVREEDRPYLIQTTPSITFPLQHPFYDDPRPLLDQIITRRESGVSQIYCVDNTAPVVKISPHPLLEKWRIKAKVEKVKRARTKNQSQGEFF